MKALCWHGKGDVRVDTVPDPKTENPRDAVMKVTSAAICGSDLHLFDGYMPTMEKGDVLGHEFMGEVVEIGAAVTNLRKGDRVVVPFTMACGSCFFCKKQLFSCCDNSNPNAEPAEEAMGQSPSGLFGYSHLLGGFAGGDDAAALLQATLDEEGEADKALTELAETVINVEAEGAEEEPTPKAKPKRTPARK